MQKENTLIKNIDMVMAMSIEYYRKVFNMYYPAFGGNGLTERNQSFNFCRHYMSIVKDAVAWQELPIKYEQNGKEIKGHIDSLIIDPTNKIIILIEAKRITKGGVNRKIKSITMDYFRLARKCFFPYQEKDKWRTNLLDYEDYDTYILLLVDIWRGKKECDARHKLINGWESIDCFKDVGKAISVKIHEVATPNNNETYHIAYRLFKRL